MSKNIFWMIILMILLIFTSCTQEVKSDKKTVTNKKKSALEQAGKLDHKKPMSWGHRQTIYVFADDSVWKYAEAPLRKNLERDYFTTENETFFEIKRIQFKQLEQFYRFNNLIFFCDLESYGNVSEYVKSIMGETVTEQVNEEFGEIYPQHNLWANDQLTLFLVGKDEESLLRMNILQSEELFNQFRLKLAARLIRKTYAIGTLPMTGFKALPWQMKIPKNYVIYKNDTEGNFLSLLARGKEKPDRYISVYYEKMAENKVNRDWLMEKRAELAWKYYDEDTFKDKDVKTEFFTIAGIKGWKLSGKWQNMKYAVGGAFQSYAFFDEEHSIAYLLDNSVYFPEGYKLATLIELEEISKTIKLK